MKENERKDHILNIFYSVKPGNREITPESKINILERMTGSVK